MKISLHKKCWLIGMAGILFCNCLIAATFTNPSFEQNSGLIKNGGATGWTAFGSANSTVISNNAQAHSGTNFLSLFQNFSGGNNYSGVYQEFPVEPGQKYTFSGYLRNGRNGTDYLQTGNSAWLQVELWNNSNYIGVIQNNSNGQGIDVNTTQDDQWLFNSMQVDVPVTANRLRFIAIHAYIGTNYNGGSSSFDDLEIKQVPPTLTNPSFERGNGLIKNGGATGWTAFGSANSTVISNSSQAYSGTNFLSLFQNFSGGNNYSGVYQEFLSEPGKKYIFSGYLRNGRNGSDYLQAGNSAWLKVEFWDKNNYIGAIQNNTNGQGIDSNTAQDDQWLFNSMRVEMPPTADRLRFVAIHAYIGTNYNGGSSSFDNLTITEIKNGTLFAFK